MSTTGAIKEILSQAELGRPIKEDQFEAARLYWREITKDLDLGRFQIALVTFLSRNVELGCIIDEDDEEFMRLLLERKDEDAAPPESKFITIGELEFLRRNLLVLNLSEVIFFAEDLPKQLASVSAASRQIAREMLAVLLLETCYANRRQSCLNSRTDKLAELLYPELDGKIALTPVSEQSKRPEGAILKPSKDDSTKMLNFSRDEITLPGKSNLEDLTVRSCRITIGSNSHYSSEYFGVSFKWEFRRRDSTVLLCMKWGLV